MDPDKAIVIPEHVISRRVGDETVILSLESGYYFGLDEVGARIWELIAGGSRLPDVVATMVGEFDVAHEQLTLDVAALVDELASQGLIEVQT